MKRLSCWLWNTKDPALKEYAAAGRKAYLKSARGRGLAAKNAATYNARKLQACPSWANKEDISVVYAKAAKEGLSVDHIIPLRGKNVCGLHVSWNLQLLPRAENSRKNNRFTSP